MTIRVPADPGINFRLSKQVMPSRYDLRLALDLRDPSWAGVDVRPAVRVDDREADGPFRYLRFRDPLYDDAALLAIAAELRPLLGAGVEVFAYFRHEDEPTAPAYAARLRELVDTS